MARLEGQRGSRDQAESEGRGLPEREVTVQLKMVFGGMMWPLPSSLCTVSSTGLSTTT